MQEPPRNQENTVRAHSSDVREEPQEEHLRQSDEAGCGNQVLLLINIWNVRTESVEFWEQEVGDYKKLSNEVMSVQAELITVNDNNKIIIILIIIIIIIIVYI